MQQAGHASHADCPECVSVHRHGDPGWAAGLEMQTGECGADLSRQSEEEGGSPGSSVFLLQFKKRFRPARVVITRTIRPPQARRPQDALHRPYWVTSGRTSDFRDYV